MLGLIVSMRFRHLRIAFSAACLIVAVLLIALWARSYWRNDAMLFTNARDVITGAGTTSGVVVSHRLQVDSGSSPRGWHYQSRPVTSVPEQFYWDSTSTLRAIHVPIWFLCVVSLAFGTLPWLPYRFSLRTLLIATTLIAVLLGLVVWLR